MKNKSEKKGEGSKIISVYWFVIFFIVAASIIYMVIVFYGKPYDVRNLEADILVDKVARCISEGGVLHDSVFSSEFQENFLEKCNFDFNVEDIYGWKEQGQYFIRTRISSFESTSLDFFEFKGGNEDLVDFCGAEGEGMPVCLEREFYVLDNENNQYNVEIFSIIRKTEKNVQ